MSTEHAGRRWWLRRSTIMASGFIVLLAAGGAAVAATTSSSSTSVGTQTFSGCLSSSGALTKIVLGSQTSQTCPSGTTSVSWTQQGAVGAAGPVGLAGVAGAAGKTGHAGPKGSAGATGPAGVSGPVGLPGAAGKTGPAGVRGPTGPSGPDGPTGLTGVAGATGSSGTAGTGLLHGAGAPAAGIGNVGDTYLDVSAYVLYGPKTSKGWGAGQNLIGPSGPPGPAPSDPTTCSGSTPTISVSTADQLTAALAAAQPGTVIGLQPGLYIGNFVASGSGTPSAPITVCGPSDAILSGTSTLTGYVLHLLNANWWEFDGFTVENGQKGVMLDGSNNNVLDHLNVHDIGDEGVHFRTFSSNNTISSSQVWATGLRKASFGEGIYVGSAQSNWCSLTGCNPDTSDGNQILNNTVEDVTAENIDIKEGTTGGLVSGNHLSGDAMVASAATGWINVKGNTWVVRSNVGTTSVEDGFQIHQVLTGWGQGNVFDNNFAAVNGPGYGYFVQPRLGNVLYCSNTATGAASGLSNVTCTPGP